MIRLVMLHHKKSKMMFSLLAGFGISQEVLGDYIGDYVVLNVSDDTKEAAASLKESDVWNNISAVKNNHVLEVDESLFYFSDPMSLDKQLDAFVSAIKQANS